MYLGPGKNIPVPWTRSYELLTQASRDFYGFFHQPPGESTFVETWQQLEPKFPEGCLFRGKKTRQRGFPSEV